MKILFDFEDRANKYWGVPLAAIDDLKSMLTLKEYKLELWVSNRESDLINSIPAQDYRSLAFLDNATVINTRPSNKKLWVDQFCKIFESSDCDYFYTDLFPGTNIKNSKRIIRLHEPLSNFTYPISEFISKGKLKLKVARAARSQAFKRVNEQSILVCSTNFIANRVSKINDIPLENLHVIPYGFNWNSFESIKSVRSNSTQSEDYYLMVSGLRGRKRPDIVINAWANLRNIPKLIVVGNIPLNSISDQARKQIEIGRLVLKPRVSEYDLNILRINANAMIFASEYEGFGRPVIEALIAGVPSIANDLEVFKEINPNAVDFFPLEVPELLEQLLIKYSHKIGEEDSKTLIQKVSNYSYFEVGKKWKNLLTPKAK